LAANYFMGNHGIDRWHRYQECNSVAKPDRESNTACGRQSAKKFSAEILSLTVRMPEAEPNEITSLAK
jgi:hypothetical protein